jgi:hypothetical protein
MELIIEKLMKETKQTERDLKILISEISFCLIKEGCEKSDPRFTQYLVRRMRKRLKIEESKTYKSFKQFFNK